MPKSSHRSARTRGFSLVELLFVLAIIGILSAVAIPSYLGQRHRARVIGDAIANAKVLQIGLESLKSDTGIYGAAGTYDWKADGTALTGPALVPTFQPAGAPGSTRVDFNLVVANGGVTYILTVNDPTLGGAMVYRTNQFGQEIFRWY